MLECFDWNIVEHLLYLLDAPLLGLHIFDVAPHGCFELEVQHQHANLGVEVGFNGAHKLVSVSARYNEDLFVLLDEVDNIILLLEL
jgi:hypothetical protein